MEFNIHHCSHGSARLIRHTSIQLPVVCLFLIAQLTVLSPAALASEFEALYQSLTEQIVALDELELNHGRHGYQLVESLHGLALTQISANRFGDADATIERAIQITRLHDGLYTSAQYPLLMTDIEVQIERRDWEEAREKMQHFGWLIGSRYEGSAQQRLDMLQWLGGTHSRGVIEDMEEDRAQHIMAATTYSELAVQYAQMTGQVDDLAYADLLYSLARSYHLETRGILNGGPTSYYLRLINPRTRAVDPRSVALGKRYRAGLDKLYMLREMIRMSDTFDLEAAAMVELYIADWNALFNQGDVTDNYNAAIDSLLQADVDADMLEHLLAVPALLPRPNLHLSVAEALAANDGGGLSIGDDVSAGDQPPEYRLVVLEPLADLSGYGLDAEGVALTSFNTDDLPALQVSMTLDPYEDALVKTAGYHARSFVTGSDVVHDDPLPMPQRALNRVLNRIKNLSFRPAFRSGQAVTALISLDFIFEDHEDWVGYPSVVTR